MNQLRQVEIVSPTETKTIRYLTDGENKRSVKIVNGVVKAYYLYDKQLRLIAELSPNQSLKSRFVYGSQGHSPDYMIDFFRGGNLFFVKDHLGSIVKVMNQQGQIKQEIQYNEFGVVLSDTNPGFQPFGFAGGHYDHETGLVRFGARDYDAKLGRWLERDPIMFEGGDTNLYSYVGQDPVNKIDPSGLIAPGVIIGAAALAGAGGSFVGTLIGGGSIGDAFNASVGGAMAGALAGTTVVAGAGTLVAAGVATVVDVLYGTTTAIESVPGPTPVQDVSNGINSILNPNRKNRLNPIPNCPSK